MSYTKRQFIISSYALIGYADYEYDLQPEDLEAGLKALDTMMGEWASKKDIGYPLPANPKDSSLNTETDVGKNYEEAIIYNLAVKIAPLKGKILPPEIKSLARVGYLNFLASAALPSTQSIVNCVYGSGSKYWVSNGNPFIEGSSGSTGTGSSSLTNLFTRLGDVLQGNGIGSYRILKNQLEATTSPTVNDDVLLGYNVSSFWFNISSDTAYVCLDNTEGSAVWLDITAGAAGGEANTASNVGTGSGVFKQKTGSDLEFNNIKSENNLLSISLDAGTNDIEFTVSQVNINSGISGLDHATKLNNISWESSGHTGEASKLAGWDISNLPDNIAIGTGLSLGGSSLSVDVGISDNKILQMDQAAGAAASDYAKFTADGIEGRSYAEVRADINVEDGADVTDATNVDAAGAVMESDYNPHTVLAATADNTPIPITISASTFLGRKSTGDITALTVSELKTELGVETTATDSDTSIPTSGALFDHVAEIDLNDRIASYELTLPDKGKCITMNNASPNTLTIPANSSVAFPVGTQIEIVQLGDGQTTIAINTDTLNSSGGATKLTGKYSSAVITKLTTTSWLLAGDITT